MAQNLKLDPTKKDYVVENGSPIPSDRVEEATYFAIAIPQGKWLYGEVGQGSQIYTLQNTKRTAFIDQQFATYAQDAIKRNVIQTGKASDVQVQNLTTSRTGTSNQIEVIPSQIQISNPLDFTPV